MQLIEKVLVGGILLIIATILGIAFFGIQSVDDGEGDGENPGIQAPSGEDQGNGGNDIASILGSGDDENPLQDNGAGNDGTLLDDVAGLGHGTDPSEDAPPTVNDLIGDDTNEVTDDSGDAGGGSVATDDSSDSTDSQASPQGGSRSRGPYREYTVRDGDFLGRIAQRELGSVKYVDDIRKLNEDLDPRRMRIGQVILLPDVARSANVITAASNPSSSGSSSGPPSIKSSGLWTGWRGPGSPSPPNAAASPVPASQPTTSNGMYLVQDGDTLSRIARKLWGKNDWKRLWDANRDRLNGPNKLKPGMMLRVPQ